MELILIVAAVVIISIVFNVAQNKRRRAKLMSKYGDSKIVDKIMRKMMWQGQTEGQLIDSLGKPSDIDQRVMKSKVRETWKYHRQGKNRYGLRITIENGQVVGWDQKN